MSYARILILISVAAMATGAFAQAPDQPVSETIVKVPPLRWTPADQVNHLASKLALTSGQRKQILQILTDRDRQLGILQSDASLTEKQQRSKAKALRRDSQAKIRNVLTDMQLTAYDEMQREQARRGKLKKLTTVASSG